MKTEHDKEIQLELIQALRDSLKQDSFHKLYPDAAEVVEDETEEGSPADEEDEEDEDEDEDAKRLDACFGK